MNLLDGLNANEWAIVANVAVAIATFIAALVALFVGLAANRRSKKNARIQHAEWLISRAGDLYAAYQSYSLAGDSAEKTKMLPVINALASTLVTEGYTRPTSDATDATTANAEHEVLQFIIKQSDVIKKNSK
ncbi:MAG: hypothetical protein LKJ05_02740 [Bifidobacteriaceae bacterium]|jgi:hypothetical protein|nr:hypothetical protein [Bifidobacteriaceae bacterium]